MQLIIHRCYVNDGGEHDEVHQLMESGSHHFFQSTLIGWHDPHVIND